MTFLADADMKRTIMGLIPADYTQLTDGKPGIASSQRQVLWLLQHFARQAPLLFNGAS